MKEQDLIDLGFKMIYVTAEESDCEDDWYYYTYEFTKFLELISSTNEEAEKKGNWYVEFFDSENEIRFDSKLELMDLIAIIENAKI